MKIRTYKVERHHDCPVYLRHYIGTTTWEYLTVINGDIYTAHIEIKKKFFQRIFGWGYARKEEEGALNYLRSMAFTTIETILDIKSKEPPKVVKNQ